MAEKIVVASGKGGVGKSSCCVGIGKMLGHMGKKVLLADFDTGLRSLDVLLNAADKIVYDWGDIILLRCEKEAAIIDCGGVDLITCPLKDSEEFTKEKVCALVSSFDSSYDFIILDAPAGIDSGLETAAAAADRALVVSTGDRVCVRSASKAGTKLESLGIRNIRLIINRFKKKSVAAKKLLNIDEVIDETFIQLIGVVPEDDEITFGNIATDWNKASTKAFMRIAGRVLGGEIPLSLK